MNPVARVVLVLSLGVFSPTQAADQFITVASTTSTEQSGLFAHLLPEFTKSTGIEVRVVALGTGQALDMGRRGDADVVFVHDREGEEKFIADGYGVRRFDVMYNDFVLAGPRSDPAKVKGKKDIAAAFTDIAQKKATFLSRGDRSGTHAAELRLWKAAGIDIAAAKGPWYKETGSGMGAALNTASSMNGYILTDRGTWLSFKNRQDLSVLVEGDKRLFNQYGVMLVNPARAPTVKVDAGQKFIDWLISPAGQNAIAAFKIDGQQLFYPNAPASTSDANAGYAVTFSLAELRPQHQQPESPAGRCNGWQTAAGRGGTVAARGAGRRQANALGQIAPESRGA